MRILNWIAVASSAIGPLTVVTLATESYAQEAAKRAPSALVRAHSHNDYYRRRPLLDALREGFFSVEADVLLRDGVVLVAHEARSARPERSLEALYLEPLRARARACGGRIHRDGPLEFRLLLDFKDAPETLWPALAPLLERYASLLSSWDAKGTLTRRAVRIVISGRKPWKQVAETGPRRVALDASLRELRRGYDPRIALCSEPWRAHVAWKGRGRIPGEDLARIRACVSRAHAYGVPLRFWGVPARARVWKRIYDEGVDVLHTDNVRGLAAFLRARRVCVLPEEWKRAARTEHGVEAWRLERAEPPLRAHLLRADLSEGRVELAPVHASGTQNEAKASGMAKAHSALGLINGGYFRWTAEGLAPFGAFALDGSFVTPARPYAKPSGGNLRYRLARAAVVWGTRRSPGELCDPALQWLACDAESGEHRICHEPYAHAARTPAPDAPPMRPLGAFGHILQAGPMLLRRGEICVPRSAHGERLFVHDKRHPRSALGLRGQLVYLLVVDGRSPRSRGATLVELATMLRALGARDAINLDGGGSSTLVLAGEVMNRPSDNGVERKIPNAIGLFARRR